MSTPQQDRVFDFVRDQLEANGHGPSFAEIGQAFGFSTVAAWKHVQALIRQERLVCQGGAIGGRGLEIPGRVDLSPISTLALEAELRRRERSRQDLAA